MNIELCKIPIRKVVDGSEQVFFGYGKLTVRPAYQWKFDKNAQHFPPNVIYRVDYKKIVIDNRQMLCKSCKRKKSIK